MVKSCHDVVGELEVEYRLILAQVSALPLRLVLLSEFSPQLKSASRVHELDLVRGTVFKEHREDEEELPVALVAPGTEMVETLFGILCDLWKLVLPRVSSAKVRFHLQ